METSLFGRIHGVGSTSRLICFKVCLDRYITEALLNNCSLKNLQVRFWNVVAAWPYKRGFRINALTAVIKCMFVSLG